MNSINNYPGIFGGETRKVNVVKLEDLSNAGVAFVSYGVKAGDKITFPVEKDLVIVSQQTRPGGTNLQYLIGAQVNGKNSWVAMGSLCRVDDETKKGATDFTTKVYDLGNHEARLKYLAGKTINATNEGKTLKAPEFKDGAPTGNLIDIPVVSIVEVQ